VNCSSLESSRINRERTCTSHRRLHLDIALNCANRNSPSDIDLSKRSSENPNEHSQERLKFQMRVRGVVSSSNSLEII
jgi:hypothetical protein